MRHVVRREEFLRLRQMAATDIIMKFLYLPFRKNVVNIRLRPHAYFQSFILRHDRVFAYETVSKIIKISILYRGTASKAIVAKAYLYRR